MNKYQTLSQLRYLLNHIEWFNFENPDYVTSLYDFEGEQDTVNKCEMGELLHTEEVITLHKENYEV